MRPVATFNVATWWYKLINDLLATRNETALKAAAAAEVSEQPTVVSAANLSSQISGTAVLNWLIEFFFQMT